MIGVKDRVETIIRDWLNTELHNPDAIPGLMVSGIAEEINKHRWDIHSRVEEEYKQEDIDSIEESMGIKLTSKEREKVLRQYDRVDDQVLDTLGIIIEDVISERDRK